MDILQVRLECKMRNTILFITVILFGFSRATKEELESHCVPYHSINKVFPVPPDVENTYRCMSSSELAERKEMYDEMTDSEWMQRSMDIAIVAQRLDGSEDEKEAARQVIRMMDIYFKEEVDGNNIYGKEISTSCQNQHELCAFWASIGECQTNFNFMMHKCTAACRLCLQSFMQKYPSRLLPGIEP